MSPTRTCVVREMYMTFHETMCTGIFMYIYVHYTYHYHYIISISPLSSPKKIEISNMISSSSFENLLIYSLVSRCLTKITQTNTSTNTLNSRCTIQCSLSTLFLQIYKHFTLYTTVLGVLCISRICDSKATAAFWSFSLA